MDAGKDATTATAAVVGSKTITIHLTDALAAVVERILEQVDTELICDSNERKLLQDCLKDRSCSAEALRCISRLKNDSDGSLRFLLKGSKGLKFPKPDPLPAPSPYLVQRRKMLIARQEQREYARMCANVSKQGKSIVDGARFSEGSTIRQASIGFNMVVMVFVAFSVTHYLCKIYSINYKVNLVLSLTAAISMMVIESILYIIRARTSDHIAKRHDERVHKNFFAGSGADGNTFDRIQTPPNHQQSLKIKKEN